MKLSDFKKCGVFNRFSVARRVAIAATLAIPIATFSACVQSPATTETAANPLPPTVIVQSQPEKIDLRGVSFARNNIVRPTSKPVLDDAAELIKTQTDAMVYVDAYCDPRGGPALNQKISDARAAAVKAYLVKRGVPADRVIARGFGATNFVASNATSEGRKENRRIELVIVRS
jgi:outer membrane protein OmpA-like peptidoglycan-associated protein